MYYINFYDQHHRDWIHDYGFITHQAAEDWLKSQGYTLTGGWYRRKQIGWEGDMKALVGLLKTYSPTTN